jgi:hypothetical protein
MPIVDDVRHQAHHVLHPKPELLKMFPLLGFFPIVHENVGL